MERLLILFLVFFLPFVLFPFGNSPFEIPKVIVCEIGIDILLLLFLFKKEFSEIKKKWSPQVTILLCIAGLSIIDLVVFKTPLSLFGNSFRLQGIFLLWHLLVFSFISSFVSISQKQWLFPVLSFSLLLGGLFVFGQNDAGRFVGSLGDPNSLCATLVFLFPFLFLFPPKRFLLFLRIISIISLFVILFLTKSHSGGIAFGIELLYLFLWQTKKLSHSKNILFCLLLLGMSLFLPFIDSSQTVEDRKQVWHTAFTAGLLHPVIGGGFGNTEILLKEAAGKLNNDFRFTYVDSSHNIFLDWFVQAGSIGLLLLGSLLFLAFHNFSTTNKGMLISLLLGILTMLCFNPLSVTTLLSFWWIIGQSMNTEKITSQT